jgi:hypothetical protein
MSFNQALANQYPLSINKNWCNVAFYDVSCNSISGTPLISNLIGNPSISLSTPSVGGLVSIINNGVLSFKTGYLSPGVSQTSIQNLILTGSQGIVTGYNPSTLNYYEQLPLNFVYSGLWASGFTRSVLCTRIGNFVCLTFSPLIQTGNGGTTLSVSGVLPSRMCPTTSGDGTTVWTQYVAVDEVSPGVPLTYFMNISTGGTITFSTSYSGTIGNAGFQSFRISYSV